MIDIIGITLVLTSKCNAACRHCGFSCGPDASDTMSLEMAKELLSGARKIATLKSVSITGGEPFLLYDEVRTIMRFAGDLGLWSEVVTNSFWADSYDVARTRLAELQQLGLRNFVTSLDEYHARFIEPERVRHAVRAAVTLGLRVTLKTMKVGGSRITPDWIKAFIPLSDSDRSVRIDEPAHVPVGRAGSVSSLLRAVRSAPAKAFAGRCDKIIRFPAVSPNGCVYPCCSFGDEARLAGSASEEPLDQILPAIQHNLLFNLLAHAGPAEVWKMALPFMTPGSGRKFFSACDICNTFYCEEEPRRAVTRLLQTMTHELKQAAADRTEP